MMDDIANIEWMHEKTVCSIYFWMFMLDIIPTDEPGHPS